MDAVCAEWHHHHTPTRPALGGYTLYNAGPSIIIMPYIIILQPGERTHMHSEVGVRGKDRERTNPQQCKKARAGKCTQ